MLCVRYPRRAETFRLPGQCRICPMGPDFGLETVIIYGMNQRAGQFEIGLVLHRIIAILILKITLHRVHGPDFRPGQTIRIGLCLFQKTNSSSVKPACFIISCSAIAWPSPRGFFISTVKKIPVNPVIIRGTWYLAVADVENIKILLFIFYIARGHVDPPQSVQVIRTLTQFISRKI